VDTHSALLLAKAHKAPSQIVTIHTLWCWIARYGRPIIIESGQGTHFIGAVIRKWASTMAIQWNYHLFYNPTATGNIERHNGLLKLKLAHLSDSLIHKALEIDALNYIQDIDYIEEAPLRKHFQTKYWAILNSLFYHARY
jgi:hypothetical protein